MATQVQTHNTPETPPVLGELPPERVAKPSLKPKKNLIKRTGRDYSQITRRSFQIAFLLLNVWIGGIFYFWVRQFEPGGAPTSLQRPAGVEGYLPIAGLMNLKYFVLTRRVPALHPAGMFLLITFLAISFLFRKAFCSWLCPVGTISEYLWRAGRKLFRRNFHLPRWLDVGLRGQKYLLLGFFAWAVSSMAAEELASFMASPYGIIADVKMQNFWCRYLCPYGALLGITSLFSPARIRRDAEGCIDCAKCAKACPSNLPVDKLVTINSAECTGCLECVAVCPAKETLSLTLPQIPGLVPQAPKIPVWAMAASIAVLF